MYEALYQCASLYPYYYTVYLIWIDKEYKRLITTKTFTAWSDVEKFANSYNAVLKFDGII